MPLNSSCGATPRPRAIPQERGQGRIRATVLEVEEMLNAARGLLRGDGRRDLSRRARSPGGHPHLAQSTLAAPGWTADARRRAERHGPHRRAVTLIRTRGLRGAAVLFWCLTAAGCHSSPAAPGAGDERDAEAIDAGDAPAPVEAGAPLGHCLPHADGACPSGSTCVEGCPWQPNQSFIPAPGGLCTFPGREQCGMGIVPNPCTTPGLACLYAGCGDYEGICVTPTEKATICAGPDAVRFACQL
jgi:hypothetical protein